MKRKETRLKKKTDPARVVDVPMSRTTAETSSRVQIYEFESVAEEKAAGRHTHLLRRLPSSLFTLALTLAMSAVAVVPFECGKEQARRRDSETEFEEKGGG
jgi:hypothetical protein